MWEFSFQVSSWVMLKLLILGRDLKPWLCMIGWLLPLGKPSSVRCNNGFTLGQGSLIAILAILLNMVIMCTPPLPFQNPIIPIDTKKPSVGRDLPLLALAWRGQPTVSFSVMLASHQRCISQWGECLLGPPWRYTQVVGVRVSFFLSLQTPSSLLCQGSSNKSTSIYWSIMNPGF